MQKEGWFLQWSTGYYISILGPFNSHHIQEDTLFIFHIKAKGHTNYNWREFLSFIMAQSQGQSIITNGNWRKLLSFIMEQ